MRYRFAIIAAASLTVAAACGGASSSGTAGGPGDPPPSPIASASPSALPTVDPQGELCQRVGDMDGRLAGLRAVELTLPNRTSLEIELDKLQAAHTELERADLGERKDELEDSLTRLGYRMGELELAVEDFKTNPRPRRAVAHVEEESEKVVNELNAFIVLSGC